MALIKCADCGNEISDQSQNCIHCGCPVVLKQKTFCVECGNELNSTDNVCNKCGCPVNVMNSESVNNIDNVIIVSNRDKSLEVFKKWYPKIFIAIIIIAIIVIIMMENSLPSYSNSRGNAIMSGFIIAILPSIILMIRCNIIYNNAKKTNITLSNKELYGVIHRLFKVSTISYPLDKISSINTIKLFGFINGIEIVSVNGPIQKVPFIDNGAEFRQAIVNQIPKYSKEGYNGFNKM